MWRQADGHASIRRGHRQELLLQLLLVHWVLKLLLQLLQLLMLQLLLLQMHGPKVLRESPRLLEAHLRLLPLAAASSL